MAREQKPRRQAAKRQENSKQEPKKLKLFEWAEADQNFVADLGSLLGIGERARKEIAEFYASRVNLHSALSRKELATLQEKTSVPESEAKNSTDLTRFILRQLASRDLSIDDIRLDMKILGCSSQESRVVEKFLRTILDGHPDLRKDALMTATTNATIWNVESLGFSIDARAVYDDDENLVGAVPVLLVRMSLQGASDEREIVFQLGVERLRQFCDMFSEQLKKLREFEEYTTPMKESE